MADNEKPVKFNVIATYSKRPQEIFDLAFDSGVGEAEVLYFALHEFNSSERNELIVLSLCQTKIGQGDKPLDWVVNHPDKCKYYFGIKE